MQRTKEIGLLTTGELAPLLHVHPSTLRRWIERYAVPHIVLPSGQLRFDPADLQPWWEERRTRLPRRVRGKRDAR